MATINDFTPMFVGDTLVPLACQFLHADGTAMDLTGATITMQMRNRSSGTIRSCTGSWTIDSTSGGTAHYPWQSNDVDTAGFFDLIVKITVSGQYVHADEKILEIKVP